MHRRLVNRMMGGVVLGAVALTLLTGCDYWPPALQAQIEQLKAEAKQAANERATLEEELSTANKLKSDLQARMDELTRTNQELASKVSTLEQALAVEHQKVAKLMEATKKPAAKASAKAPVSKKSKSAKASHAGKESAKKKKPNTRQGNFSQIR